MATSRENNKLVLAGQSNEIDGWLEKNLPFFCPLDWHNTEERRLRRKAFAELSLFLFLKRKNSRDIPSKLGEFVVETANSLSFLGLLSSRPSDFLLFASAFLYPNAIGALGSPAKQVISDLISEPSLWASERVPFRDLDLCYFVSQFDPACDHLQRSRRASHSIVRERPLASYMSVEDAYALTHTVFYLTDFASIPTPLSELNACGDLSESLDALLCRFLSEGNNDLSLEIVAAALMLGLPLSVASSCCIEIAIDLLGRDGYVNTLNPEFLHELSQSTPEFQDWAKKYHTMLVAGFTFDLLNVRNIELLPLEHDRQLLLKYGKLLSSAHRADVFGVCSSLAELHVHGFGSLPDWSFQYPALIRVLERHCRLLRSSQDAGLLIDAVRALNITSCDSSETLQMLVGTNELVKAVLNGWRQAFTDSRLQTSYDETVKL